MERVSVRDLRQHLTRYLRRVEEGEHLIVTARRRPVAMLGPLPENVDILDLMIATGEATAPVGDLLDLPPPYKSTRPGPSASEILDELREERL